MSIRNDLRHRLMNLIKQFRFDELESCVIPIFPEISWNQIKTRMIKDGNGCTVKNASHIIENVITVNPINNSMLRERLITLELIEVSRHYKKKTWRTFVLKGPTTNVRSVYSNNELKSRIMNTLRTYEMRMHVTILTHDGVTYVSMRPVSKIRTRVNGSFGFFAFFPKLDYIFSSNMEEQKESLLSLVNALGFRKTKKINLEGSDVHSLMRLLAIKEQRTVDGRDFSETRKLKDPLPVYTRMGMDFRQNKQRLQHTNECFGDEPPMLQSFTVTLESETWEDPDIMAKIPNEEIVAQISFQGPNVAELLAKLAEQKIFTSPLPEYVANAMKLGKNKFKLRGGSDSEESDSNSH